MDTQKIGKFLKELRKQNNMTQEQLGERILEKMESKEKKFENMMLLIMGITSVLTIAIMFLLPNGDNLTTMERIKEIIVIIFVWAMAFISNTLNIVAIGLRKNK